MAGILLILLLVGGLVFLKIKMPAIKGRLGEKSVAAVLSFLPKDEYIVLNDMMFGAGIHTTQIDHIVVSIHGIFVIETKNYKGWIYGNSNNEYWTQNIYGNKYSLYNPLLQNKNHIKFLIKKFDGLRQRENYIYPIIVFIRASNIQVSGDNNCVLWLSQLNTYIRSCQQNIMTIDECRHIAQILESENIKDKKERAEHNANVRQAIYRKDYKVFNGICPRCGGQLILRNGRYGSFYGCSNYPKCRFTR